MIDEKEMEILDFEIPFYEKLVLDKPDFVDVLIPLGDAYTKKGLHEKGLEVDRRLSRLCPDNPYVHYNLACSLSLLGQLDEAFPALERALSLGYSDVVHMEGDPDLENLRKDPRYQKLLRKSKSKSKRKIHSKGGITGEDKRAKA